MAQKPDAAYELDAVEPSGDNGDTGPSDAAYVVVTTTPDGPGMGLSVPAKHSARLLDTVALSFCVVGVLFAPYLTSRVVAGLGANVPWQVEVGLVALSVVAPLMAVVFLRHRRR